MSRTFALVAGATLAGVAFGVGLGYLAFSRVPPSTPIAVGLGSYRVEVARVLDGDTIQIKVPDMRIPELNSLKVRVPGIDTPETGHRAKCRDEHDKAVRATALTTKLLADNGDTIIIDEISWDKYGGRINAEVHLGDGTKLADKLIEEGLARPYDGRGQRPSWCPPQTGSKP
jgi:endonuclease YncB( thermonuclease family)